MKFRLIEELLNEDIESMKKYFPNIPDEQFQSLIELDPTYTPGSKNAGTYGRWILTLANKGKLNNIGHVKDLLTRFNDESKYLKNKDIMRYKTMDEVEDMLNNEDSYKEQSHRQEVRDRQKARKNADLENEAKKVYEDSNWEVWVPLTYAASCKLGQGSSWCTASTESDYYYNYYKKSYGGNYYININKQDPDEKYQFHFESGQYMNIDDEEIDLSDFFKENPSLKPFYSDIMFNSYVKSWGIGEDGKATVDVDTIARQLSQDDRDIGESFLKACFSGDLIDYFDDYGNYSTAYDVENALDYVDDKNSDTLTEMVGTSPDSSEFMDIVEDEYPEVYEALLRAVSEGISIGAEDECYHDFENSLYSSSRPLISDWTFYGGDTVGVTVNLDYMKENIVDIISIITSVIDDLADFSMSLSGYMEEDWSFSEPRYGWSGFDKSAFNERLLDELSEL